MARRATTNYRFLTSDPIQGMATEFELDESDMWGVSTRSDSPDSRPRNPSSRRPLAAVRSSRCGGVGEPKSVPVNIPDWSKILREEYGGKMRGERIYGELDGGEGGGYDGGDGEEWIAPHEYLARTRKTSFSVHEGIGRTLKGRDLSRVRNAIWEKTGFQD